MYHKWVRTYILHILITQLVLTITHFQGKHKDDRFPGKNHEISGIKVGCPQTLA